MININIYILESGINNKLLKILIYLMKKRIIWFRKLEKDNNIYIINKNILLIKRNVK